MLDACYDIWLGEVVIVHSTGFTGHRSQVCAGETWHIVVSEGPDGQSPRQEWWVTYGAQRSQAWIKHSQSRTRESYGKGLLDLSALVTLHE